MDPERRGLGIVGSITDCQFYRDRMAVSTYLRDGFKPAAIASDSQGNIYLAGTAVIDAASQATGVAVAKLDPKVSQYLYLSYFDSAAGDQVAAFPPPLRRAARTRGRSWSS